MFPDGEFLHLKISIRCKGNCVVIVANSPRTDSKLLPSYFLSITAKYWVLLYLGLVAPYLGLLCGKDEGFSFEEEGLLQNTSEKLHFRILRIAFT